MPKRIKKNSMQEAIKLAKEISQYTEEGIVVLNSFLEDFDLEIIKRI